MAVSNLKQRLRRRRRLLASRPLSDFQRKKKISSSRHPKEEADRFARWIRSQSKGKGSTYQQDENSLGSHIGYARSDLPEDIWCRVHSLMPMRESARVASVSQAFLHSWRCHPNLHFSKQTLGLNENACQKDGTPDFKSRVDNILKKHSGIGVKAFKLEVFNEDLCHDHLDRWLQAVVKPGIEELDLRLTRDRNYNPWPLLSGEIGGTLKYLSLSSCQFHPTVKTVCLRSLITLELNSMHIKASELGCLLSGSLSLERLKLFNCDIDHLKIPSLQWLNHLVVLFCHSLRAIESKAPNLSNVRFGGDFQIPLSLENMSRIKIFNRHCNGTVFYACTNLPSVMPNLEALTIRSEIEMVNAVPMLPSKFLHLKFLSIAIGGLSFDYLSLISFLDASPSLETFILAVILVRTKVSVSVLEDPSDLRVIPGHIHSKLKHVKIIRFTAAKSLAELTCQILNSTTSLECLTLDTTGLPTCSASKMGYCRFVHKGALIQAQKGVKAAQIYIKPKVPSTVEFNLLEPCSRCHVVSLNQ